MDVSFVTKQLILVFARFTNKMWLKIGDTLKGQEGYNSEHIKDIKSAWTPQKKKSLKSIENLENMLKEKGIALITVKRRNHLIKNLRMYYEHPFSHLE